MVNPDRMGPGEARAKKQAGDETRIATSLSRWIRSRLREFSPRYFFRRLAVFLLAAFFFFGDRLAVFFLVAFFFLAAFFFLGDRLAAFFFVAFFFLAAFFFLGDRLAAFLAVFFLAVFFFAAFFFGDRLAVFFFAAFFRAAIYMVPLARARFIQRLLSLAPCRESAKQKTLRSRGTNR